MKKLLFILAAAFLFQPVMAQQKEKPTVEARAERKTAKMTRELQLTAEQQPKVKAETEKFIKKSDEIRAKHADTKTEAAQTEMKTARQEYRTNMKTILTADQFAKWQEFEKGRKKPTREPATNK